MMLGIGVDIIKINRMKDILSRSGELFLKKAFTKQERRQGEESERPEEFFSATFAAKEAVFKLFGHRWEKNGGFQDIEIIRGGYGEPMVRLHGKFSELAETHPNSKVLLSISYEEDTAIAVAAWTE